MALFVDNLDGNSQVKGVNFVDPSSAQDVATKNYVDTNKGGVVGIVQLANNTPVAGGSATNIEWGAGANALDATPVWFNPQGNTISPQSWLNISNPNQPLVTAGTYVLEVQITPSGPIVTETVVRVILGIQATGHPNNQPFLMPVPQTLGASDFGAQSIIVTPNTGFVHGRVFTTIEATSTAGNLGVVNYNCGLLIFKLA